MDVEKRGSAKELLQVSAGERDGIQHSRVRIGMWSNVIWGLKYRVI